MDKRVYARDDEESNAEDGAVGGYERKKDSKHSMYHRAETANKHFSELHERANHHDKDYGPHKFQFKRDEQIVIDDITATACQCQDERSRHGHTERIRKLGGYPHKGAEP